MLKIIKQLEQKCLEIQRTCAAVRETNRKTMQIVRRLRPSNVITVRPSYRLQ